MLRDKTAAELLIEDLKRGLAAELKEEIYGEYIRRARWDREEFEGRKSRFELADLDNAFVREMMEKYGIGYREYLEIYCEVRNDGFFSPDEIEDVEAFVKEQLSRFKRRVQT